MDNFLVTGGTGFIGSWLSSKPHGIMSLLDTRLYREGSWKSTNWRYIIHLAPTPIDDVIQCARQGNSTVLFASSGGVYDAKPNDYFRMKIEDERKLLASGVDCRIARIFTTCGANMDWQRYAIGKFIAQAEAGEPLTVYSGGMVTRSYLYGSDLADWLWSILFKGKNGAIYEVGSDEPHNTQELAFEIAGYYDPPAEITISNHLHPEPRPYYVPDITKCMDELGLFIKVPFSEAVRLTIEDYRNEHSAI
jgi:nucleoside-diphosphate-sugar epimerase